jgi:hypothetical protein
MKKFHIILIVLFGFFMMPTTFACGNSNSGSALWKCLLDEQERLLSKDSHSKKKHNDCNGKCGKALCSAPSVKYSNTSLQSI